MFGQAGTSTFGSPAPATGGSLFGNAGAASTPASSGAGASSLFGAAASTNTLNFGAPTSTATSAAAPAFGSAAPSTSLFGSTGKPATTPSLFASSTAGTNSAGFGAANPSTSTAPSSFGAASATTSAPAFGASSTLSGFGTTAPAKTTASAFGAANPLATTAAATTASALAPANLTKQTRVADLPQASRSILEEFERYQQTQLHIGEQLAMRDTPSQIEQAAQRLQDLDQQRSGLTFALAADAQRLDDLKQKVNTELRSLEAAARILGDQRLGTTAHLAHASALVSTPAASLPFAYYWELISAFDAKYQEYDKLASQIETHLATFRRHHVNGKDEYSAVGEHQPATTLNNAMRYMHDSFMALLSQVSAVHSQVNDLARAMD